MPCAGSAAAASVACRRANELQSQVGAGENFYDRNQSPGGSRSNAPAQKKISVSEGTTETRKPLGFLPWPQETVKRFYNRGIVQGFVAAVICGNFVVTILEKEYDPYPPELQRWNPTWVALDYTFNIIFLVELMVNMYGSLWKEFWGSGWNIFDTIVVLVGVLTMSKAPLGPFSDLKMLRAFRVFRLFKRIPALRKIITSLMRSIPGVMNAFIIMLIVMSIYSILAVDYLKPFGDSGTCTELSLDLTTSGSTSCLARLSLAHPEVDGSTLVSAAVESSLDLTTSGSSHTFCCCC